MGTSVPPSFPTTVWSDPLILPGLRLFPHHAFSQTLTTDLHPPRFSINDTSGGLINFDSLMGYLATLS